jgi:hypothetical protein
MGNFKMMEICDGVDPIKRDPWESELRDDVDLWRELFLSNEADLLAWWISGHPATRPVAWWKFRCGMEPPEDQRGWLEDAKLLTPADLDEMTRRALWRIEYNRGRPPGTRCHVPDNDGLIAWCAARGLIQSELNS